MDALWPQTIYSISFIKCFFSLIVLELLIDSYFNWMVGFGGTFLVEYKEAEFVSSVTFKTEWKRHICLKSPTHFGLLFHGPSSWISEESRHRGHCPSYKHEEHFWEAVDKLWAFGTSYWWLGICEEDRSMTVAASPVNTCTPKKKLVQFLSGALEKSSCLRKPRDKQSF